eukprot:107390-Rhodomonas_salina.1
MRRARRTRMRTRRWSDLASSFSQGPHPSASFRPPFHPPPSSFIPPSCRHAVLQRCALCG